MTAHLIATEPGHPASMPALATFTVDKQSVEDRKQPGTQAVINPLLAAPAQGPLYGGLDQIIGAAAVAGQPQGEAAQALEHLA
ncbi:hypothetical protein D9M73_141440 [compost metagenome]